MRCSISAALLISVMVRAMEAAAVPTGGAIWPVITLLKTTVNQLSNSAAPIASVGNVFWARTFADEFLPPALRQAARCSSEMSGEWLTQ